MASREYYIQLAKQLPPQLQRFLARYPTVNIQQSPKVPKNTKASSSPPSTSPSKSKAPAQTPKPKVAPKPPAPVLKKTGYQTDRPSPFTFYKHPITGKWQDPVYSYRRQSDLVKTAMEFGLETLMPDSAKAPGIKVAKRVRQGLRVKGTGVGQTVKGKAHERMLVRRMAVRRKAMLRMPNLIKIWRRVGTNKWGIFPKRHGVL